MLCFVDLLVYIMWNCISGFELQKTRWGENGIWGDFKQLFSLLSKKKTPMWLNLVFWIHRYEISTKILFMVIAHKTFTDKQIASLAWCGCGSSSDKIDTSRWREIVYYYLFYFFSHLQYLDLKLTETI